MALSDDVTAKELGYRSLRESAPFKTLSLACDVWAAAPLAEKRDGLPILTQRAVDRALDGSLSDEATATGRRRSATSTACSTGISSSPRSSAAGDSTSFWETRHGTPSARTSRSSFPRSTRRCASKIETDSARSSSTSWRPRRSRRDGATTAAGCTPPCTRSRTAAATACSLPATSARATSISTECSLRRRSPSQVHDGFTAQIVPENLANGANAAAIRQELFDRRRLDLLLTFENRREVWFKGLDSTAVFCLYSARRADAAERFRAAFDIRDVESLRAAEAGAAPHPACARRGVLARRAGGHALLFPGRNRGGVEGVRAVPAIRR